MLFPFLTSVPQPYVPPLTSGNVLWLDGADLSTYSATLAYGNISATGSGTSGTTVITASATVANLVQAGFKIRIGGTDIYTVAGVSTTTINTVETLTTNYSAGSALALNRTSKWLDKSGYANDTVTQGVLLSRPILKPAGQNGLNVLSGDGASRLQLPSALFTIPNGPSTVFIVSRQLVTGSLVRPFEMNKAGSGRYNIEYEIAANTIGFTSRAGGAGVTVAGVTTTNFNIITGRRSGTTQAISFNNGAETSNANASDEPGITAGTVFGIAGNSIIGDIAEVALWNRSLSAAEMNVNAHYFANKWAVTIPTNS